MSSADRLIFHHSGISRPDHLGPLQNLLRPASIPPSTTAATTILGQGAFVARTPAQEFIAVISRNHLERAKV